MTNKNRLFRNGGYESSPLIGRFCGTRIPATIPSFSNQLYLRFKTDSSDSASGAAAGVAGRSKIIDPCEISYRICADIAMFFFNMNGRISRTILCAILSISLSFLLARSLNRYYNLFILQDLRYSGTVRLPVVGEL